MTGTGPIVIVAPPGDAHALVVAARIDARGHDVVIWDSARLPAADQFSLRLTPGEKPRIVLDSSACGTIDMSEIRSIWWRRPRPPTIPGSVAGDYIRSYCRSETDQLLRGALSGLRVPIHNDPDAEEKACRKPYQLAIASEVGFSVPRTLITSSPEKAASFCRASPHGVVVKPFRTPPGSLCATQDYTHALSDKLDLLQNAPVIFQERVPPHKDVRVSVIGDMVFAGVSESAQLDWRVDGTLTWKAHDLPGAIERHILLLLRRLGLTLGHLDFRLAPDGEYVFFEVNPGGQFLFLEIDDHAIAVTSALAELLIGPRMPLTAAG